MTTLREAAQMALDWAGNNGEAVFAVGGWDAVSALNKWSQPLRAALAQPEQEPVAALWQHGETERTRVVMSGDITDCDANWSRVADLYTAPPQREWQGLTDEEIEKLFVWQEWSEDFADYEPVARSIERILREKNT